MSEGECTFQLGFYALFLTIQLHFPNIVSPRFVKYNLKKLRETFFVACISFHSQSQWKF